MKEKSGAYDEHGIVTLRSLTVLRNDNNFLKLKVKTTAMAVKDN
jgi:hypothetical protein